jgi:hypothetical protein
MPETLCTLQESKGRLSSKLVLTDESLIEEGMYRARRWRRSWPLRDLSPEVDSTTGRPEHTTALLATGMALVALGVCFYISDFHIKMPLLAPLLVAVGLWPVGRALTNWRIQTWTIFRKRDGSVATHVIHRGSTPEERERFERMFAETVRHVQRGDPD